MTLRIQPIITVFTVTILAGALTTQLLFYSFYGINVFYYSTINELIRFFLIDFIVMCIPVLLMMESITSWLTKAKQNLFLIKSPVPKHLDEFWEAYKISYLKDFITVAYIFENILLYTPIGMFSFFWLLLILIVKINSVLFVKRLNRLLLRDATQGSDFIRRIAINFITFYFMLVSYGAIARFLTITYGNNSRRYTIIWNDKSINTGDTLRKVGELDKFIFLYNTNERKITIYSKEGLVSLEYKKSFFKFRNLDDTK
jgi:hypothetical protein